MVTLPFRGEYRYRIPIVFVAGLVATVFPGIALVHFVRAFVNRSPVGNEVWAALFVVGIVIVLFVSGCWLLGSYIRGLCLKLEISEEGVSYGQKFYKWSDISWFHAVKYREWKYQMALHLHGCSTDRRLMIDVGISHEDYRDLVAMLQPRLTSRYPNLTIN